MLDFPDFGRTQMAGISQLDQFLSAKLKMTNDKVEAAIHEIERRYAIGQEILKTCGPTSPAGLIKQEASKHGLPRDTCQKLRAMAAEETGYSRAELDSLYKRFRKAEHALTISHFIKLVSVPKGALRTELTDLAMNKKWSSHRLQAEIVARQGRRATGGRKPTVVGGDQIESELARVLWSWSHWIQVHEDSLAMLRPELHAKVGKLMKKIEKLQKVLDEVNQTGGE